MTRRVFSAQPVAPWWLRDEETKAEHEAWIREVYARHHPGEEPQPCDCGYYDRPALVTCHGAAREACHRGVATRLENHARHEHERFLRGKRAFPGVPFPKAGRGRCKWCSGTITLGRVKQREWHDGRGDEPDCFGAYCLHTRLDVQQLHLIDRDGLGCRLCGTVEGRWRRVWAAKYERLAADPGRYDPAVYVGDVDFARWFTSLEVDHFIALAVAWEGFSDDARRRWFFSPANLRLICGACHKAKTREDVALLKLCYDRGAEWAKAEVLRRLSDAGLLRSPGPKEPAHVRPRQSVPEA